MVLKNHPQHKNLIRNEVFRILLIRAGELFKISSAFFKRKSVVYPIFSFEKCSYWNLARINTFSYGYFHPARVSGGSGMARPKEGHKSGRRDPGPAWARMLQFYTPPCQEGPGARPKEEPILSPYYAQATHEP